MEYNAELCQDTRTKVNRHDRILNGNGAEGLVTAVSKNTDFRKTIHAVAVGILIAVIGGMFMQWFAIQRGFDELRREIKGTNPTQTHLERTISR